jgi:hypothetical protein
MEVDGVELRGLKTRKRHLIEKYNREKNIKSHYLQRNWQREAADCKAAMDAIETEIAKIDGRIQTELGVYLRR